eukprot:s802_g10.t1
MSELTPTTTGPLNYEEICLARELLLRALRHGQMEIWTPIVEALGKNQGSASQASQTAGWIPRVVCAKLETGTLRGSRKRTFEKMVAAAEASREDKVLLWRKFARGKGKKAWPKVQRVNFAQLKGWLKARRLSDCFALRRLKRKDLAEMRLSPAAGVQILWGSYRNVTAPVSAETSGWLPAYHGTWFYGLWSILHHGIFLESTNEGRGHEFWAPGVYVTRRFETAREYARPHQLFGDGTFYRCVVKVRYNPQEVRKQRSKGGDQVVVPSCAVVIEGVFFCANDPPTKGEERFEDWQDELEVIPCGFESLGIDEKIDSERDSSRQKDEVQAEPSKAHTSPEKLLSADPPYQPKRRARRARRAQHRTRGGPGDGEQARDGHMDPMHSSHGWTAKKGTGLVTQISALARCLEVSRRSDQWILWMNDCRQAGDPALPQQRFWTPVKEGNIRWTPLPSKCIDGSAGGALELKDCVMDDTSSSASNQRFLMPPSLEGPLRWSPNSDMCLTMESVDGSGSVRLAPCDEGHRQRFRVPPGGQDVLCAGGLALSSSGAGAPLMARAAALSAGNRATMLKIKGGLPRFTDLTERLLTERSMVNGSEWPLPNVTTEKAAGQRGMELWNEVGQVLRAALVLEAQDGKLVMESLAMSPWPISELLSWAVQMKHQGQKPEMFEGALAHAVGMCACDMSLWSPMEARAVADAQRVLEEMNQLTSEDVDQLSEVALSAALCDSISWDSRLLAATTLLKEMVKDPQIQEEELHTETWDRICLPAVR